MTLGNKTSSTVAVAVLSFDEALTKCRSELHSPRRYNKDPGLQGLLTDVHLCYKNHKSYGNNVTIPFTKISPKTIFVTYILPVQVQNYI